MSEVATVSCVGQDLPIFNEKAKKGSGLALLHAAMIDPFPFRYFDDWRLAIDNNACGQAVRPSMIGRHNRLFADTPAAAWANLYSLIETAKDREPYRYLRLLFTELPKTSSPDQVAALLPCSVTQDDIPAP